MSSLSAPAPSGETPRPADKSLASRGDIDGLRAVAIVVVVAVPRPRALGFSGGFVGVDVFFVISGWLITQPAARRRSSDRHTTASSRLLGPAYPATGARGRRCMIVDHRFSLSLVLLSPLDWSLIAQNAAVAARYIRRRTCCFAWRGPATTSPVPLKDEPVPAHLVARRRRAVLPRLADRRRRVAVRWSRRQRPVRASDGARPGWPSSWGSSPSRCSRSTSR